MKIRVTINGILEAEAEFPDPGSSTFIGRDWNTWHENQHTQAITFITRCADKAIAVAQAMPRELESPEPNA